MQPCATTERITTRHENKQHPEPSGNQAVWKSDTQGFKEGTFIQMGGRGRVAASGGKTRRRAVVQRGGGSETVVPHSGVVEKSGGICWDQAI